MDKKWLRNSFVYLIILVAIIALVFTVFQPQSGRGDQTMTLSQLAASIKRGEVKSIKVCGLLVKDRQRAEDVQVDYVGFDIPDRFVVGYGLDYAETYRNLPYVAALKPSLYRDSGGGTTANQ